VVSLRRTLFVLAVLWARLGHGAEVDLTHWIDAAQDSTGVVWAISDEGEQLFSNDGSGWQAAQWQNDMKAPMRPLAMTRAPTGAVVILWQHLFEPRNFPNCLSEQRGDKSRQITNFVGGIGDYASLFVDTKGRSWITHLARGIYRVDPNHHVGVAHEITDVELVDKENSEAVEDRQLNAIHAFESSKGEIWFWSEKEFSERKSLKSFLVYDGSNFLQRHFAELPPGARCYCAVSLDGRHALAAFDGLGLYRLDLIDLKASRMAEPDEDAFNKIFQIIPTEGATYVIASANEGQRKLWVIAATGTAAKAGIPVENVSWDFPAVRCAAGLVIGSGTRGMLFLADGSNDFERLDWRSNFPFCTINRLFALPHNRLLGVARGEGSVVFSMPPWPKPPINPAIEMVESYGGLVKDGRGHLWTRDAGLKNVREWDGKSWHEHTLPPHKDVIGPLLTDNQGRIWANAYEAVFIWDTTGNEWRTEANLRRALEVELMHDRNFALRSNDVWHFSFSGDGRVAFRDDTRVALNYFDGSGWKEWRAEHSQGLPHFDERLNLYIFDRDRLWRFLGDHFRIQPEITPAPAWASEAVALPAKDSALWPCDSLARDETGAFWIVSEHQLYRQREQLRVPVFGAGEPNPFCDGRHIVKAVSDSVGNVFLTTSVPDECVLIRRKLPRPTTRVEIAARQDLVRAKMRTNIAGRHWFTWRLDNENWCEPAERTEIVLDSLPNGRHTFEARAIDERLEIDESGASGSFILSVDPRKRISNALEQLHSRDFSMREHAVRTLVKQSRLALPALKQARGKANAGERWWIDAAIQEIERGTGANRPRK
jgi:streptogramin lyase